MHVNMTHLFSLGEGRWSVGICFSPFCNNTPLLRDVWIFFHEQECIIDTCNKFKDEMTFDLDLAPCNFGTLHLALVFYIFLCIEDGFFHDITNF